MMLPVWLKSESEHLSSLLERDQLPHALLIHGPAGVGRRLLAFWLMDRLLGQVDGIMNPTQLGAGRIDDAALPLHPDFKLLQPLTDEKTLKEKKTISVEQVRELIGFLSLTSHQNGAKVVIVAPAQAMTASAANCLLKTLEEPAANSYLILVAEALSRLPSTIISRCHRIRVPLPDRQVAGHWLDDIDSAVDWQSALELSAGAPLAALEWQQTEFLQIADQLALDIQALQQRQVTPAGVAKRWAKYNLDPCLRWLYNRLGAEIRSKAGRLDPEPALKPGNRHLQKSGETLTMEPSFAVLRQIGELRRLQGSGLNMELQLTDVLSQWYGNIGRQNLRV